MGIEDALRETSDTLLVALDQLTALEEHKRTLQPDDPEIVELSSRIEDIAEQILGASAAQRQLTEVSLGMRGAPDAPTMTIDSTPRPAAVILREWREAERLAADAEPGSPGEQTRRQEADALRAEYRRAFERASRNHRPGPGT